MSRPDSRFTIEQFFWFFRTKIALVSGFLDHTYPLLPTILHSFCHATSTHRGVEGGEALYKLNR